MSEHHSFDIHIAQEYGIKEAIIIHHFQHWIGVNQRKPNGKKTSFRDGKWWTYQTLDDIAAHFPYLSKSEIFDAIEKLCTGKGRRSKKGQQFEPVLVKGNYNKTKFDKTIWYAFANEEKFTVLAQAKMENGSSQYPDRVEPTPIPDTKTDTKKDNKEYIAQTEKNDPPSDKKATTREDRSSQHRVDFQFSSISGKFEGIAQEDLDAWKIAYPNTDLNKEIIKAEQWLLSNPSKAKKKNWRRFLTSWLQRVDDHLENKKAFRSNQTPFGKPKREPLGTDAAKQERISKMKQRTIEFD